MRPSRVTAALALGLLLAACEDALVKSHGELRIISAPELDGVVNSTLPSEIVLEYLDEHGAPRANQLVDIRCGGLESSSTPCLAVGVPAVGEPQSYFAWGQYETDDDGRITLVGRFLSDAGTGWLRFHDNIAPFVDSIPFTVRPGPAVSVQLAPRDTAVRINRTVRLRGFAYDAHGNARADALSWTVTGPAAELASASVVRGLAYGRALVRVSLGALRDSQWVSVVPSGTLAATWSNPSAMDDDEIRIFETDGSGALPAIGHAVCIGKLSWSPTGHRIAYDRTPPGGGCFQQRLYTITPSGSATRVRADTGILHGESMATWSPDGQFIHFIGRTDHQNGEVWRVPATGGLGTRLGPVAGYFDEDWHPAASPNGAQVVFGSLRSDTLRLKLITTQTGAVQDLGIRAMAGSWSPDGSQIAFAQRVLAVDGADRFRYHLMNANGTGIVAIGDTLGHMSSAPSWSSNGEWIAVVLDSPGGWGGMRLALVEVSTGLTLPLGWTQDFTSVSWKPTP